MSKIKVVQIIETTLSPDDASGMLGVRSLAILDDNGRVWVKVIKGDSIQWKEQELPDETDSQQV